MEKSEQQIEIHVPLQGNELLEKVLEAINKNQEIKTLWLITNVNATQRLGWSDHGPVHFQIVANSSLRIARLLFKTGVVPSIVKDFNLTQNHAELVIVLGSLLHDIGMSVDREGHEEYSLFLANNLLREILEFLPLEEKVIVTSETLHAIISHRADGTPKTIEAGIVRVADALDMTKGRARIPYEKGNVSIHSISAAAIDSVEIEGGVERPVQIAIAMNNSSGIFQVDELLKEKLHKSGIEKYIEVRAYIDKTEESLVKELNIKA